MAIPTVKTTYTVDAETKRVLDELAARWEVSRSEALRRAIRQAAGAAGAGDRQAALEALQQQAGMTSGRARRWERAVRAERRASTGGRTRAR
ncbi:MAG: ribbon-helix-helix protein, CopG family [Acidobacteria bacterium]|nr:ribbon-helix-helix protein, CopG family [Acidobacteriota bacterium]